MHQRAHPACAGKGSSGGASRSGGWPVVRAAMLPTLSLLFVLLQLGCATLPAEPSVQAAADGSIVTQPLEIGGTVHRATWYMPRSDATALLVLQHGFARRCEHLRETTTRLMAGGLIALCIDAGMAGGNLPLADALADRLAAGLPAPDGRPLPQRIIVGGHSAGGRFAARLGARLAARAPSRLAGALLFDPVATAGFEAELRLVSDAGARPVLALFALPHACNAQLNAAPALRQVRQDALRAGREGFVGLMLTEASSHADVEGEDTDWIAVAACGRPAPENTARLRALAASWGQAVSRGTPPEAPPTDAAWRFIE